MLSKLFVLIEVIDAAGPDCCHAIPSPVSDFEYAVMIATTSQSILHQPAHERLAEQLACGY